ncbi:MAG: nucleotidyltransferase domain-containing protein [Candidatus Saganbacteria bacterium]|nr:nucleotidyltransferase domain-containing protein [Candidatus Saganbacteria bacterium]
MEEDIESIAGKIAKGVNPKRLVLFGSRALGRANQNSDIDLCVINNEIKDKSQEFIRIRKLLKDFIQPIDILFFSEDEFKKRKDIWGTIQYEIDKKGKILYERRD